MWIEDANEGILLVDSVPECQFPPMIFVVDGSVGGWAMAAARHAGILGIDHLIAVMCLAGTGIEQQI